MLIQKTMKALVARSVGNYALMDVPIPTPASGEILLRVEACGICAGDLKAYQGASRFWGGNGNPGYCEPPFIPGHEFLGEIVQIGANTKTNFKIGDRIISEQIVPCGTCWYCRRHLYWLCQPHDVYGFKKHLNGGMAEYVLLPTGSINYRVPKTIPTKQAVLIEPFSCSMHGVRQSGATADDVVVLAGAGTLGLGMIAALHLRNPKKLIVLDLNERRLKMAKRFGADITLNPTCDNVYEQIMELTQGVGCDIYIEATGHPSAVQQGLDLLRKGGTFVEFSVMNGSSSIDWSILGDVKELTIRGSQLSPHCYEDVISLIEHSDIPTDDVVTHSYCLEQWKEAFEMAHQPEALKVIFTFPQKAD